MEAKREESLGETTGPGETDEEGGSEVRGERERGLYWYCSADAHGSQLLRFPHLLRPSRRLAMCR